MELRRMSPAEVEKYLAEWNIEIYVELMYSMGTVSGIAHKVPLGELESWDELFDEEALVSTRVVAENPEAGIRFFEFPKFKVTDVVFAYEEPEEGEDEGSIFVSGDQTAAPKELLELARKEVEKGASTAWIKLIDVLSFDEGWVRFKEIVTAAYLTGSEIVVAEKTYNAGIACLDRAWYYFSEWLEQLPLWLEKVK